jgi:DNA-3-methyladenine glycosylase
VYFIYGVHWCFNAVTRAVGLPSAVLVRALEPLDGVELMRERREVANDRDLTNGPGKLCEALGITGALNGLPLSKKPIEILRGEPVPDSEVQVTARVGITKSAEWPLRWLVKGNPYVSKTPKHLRPE